ncbi:MAG: glycosyltransferase, partial [Burkholderiaceae bacterium]
LAQRYAGELSIVVVDDHSDDGTAAVVRQLVDQNVSRTVSVLSASALPAGWTGKLWAIQQGIAHIERAVDLSEFILLTDADICYADGALTHLVGRALKDDLVLTSFMAKLRCESAAERLLIPAFIFFFQMLYPFSWVARIDKRTAAAAGGCMLIRRNALNNAGGVAAIRSALIDDCSLARNLKQQGAIWLGLTDRVVSLRAYPSTKSIRQMVARTAYAQLKFSPALLALTVILMSITYLAPPLVLLVGPPLAKICAAAAWAAMALLFQPTLRFYRVSPWYGLMLPAIAAFYLMFTLESAYQHFQGRNAEWKGRVYPREAMK